MQQSNTLWNKVKEFNILLIIGTVFALFVVNTNPLLYDQLSNISLGSNHFLGHYHNGHYELDLKFIINDGLMALYFFIAGKEVYESIALKNGALRGKQALSILLTTLGGVIVPILLFLVVALMLGSYEEIHRGWAIPTATDIAFALSAFVILLGVNHPAKVFLIAIAILDDIIGMINIGIFYPSHELQLEWLLLSVLASFSVFVIFNYLPRTYDNENKHKKVSEQFKQRFGLIPYVVAGIVSWYAFFKAGIHPALGLLPIIPAIPHAEKDFGFLKEEGNDLLNQFEHKLDTPIHFVLLVFGFVNAGVVFAAESFSAVTIAVVTGLIAGKVIGITIFGIISDKLFGLPKGVSPKILPVLGAIAGIGFTVSLFISIQAFEPGIIQDGAKMGSLLSFSGVIVAAMLIYILNIKKVD